MRDRERLAWTVLLVCFGVFIALLIGVPVGSYQWVQRAATDPSLVLQTLEGTAQVEAPDETARLLLAQQGPLEIRSGTIIFNDDGAETVLSISSPHRGRYLFTCLCETGLVELKVLQPDQRIHSDSTVPDPFEQFIIMG